MKVYLALALMIISAVSCSFMQSTVKINIKEIIFSSVIHNAHGNVMILIAQQYAILYANPLNVTQAVLNLKTPSAM